MQYVDVVAMLYCGILEIGFRRCKISQQAQVTDEIVAMISVVVADYSVAVYLSMMFLLAPLQLNSLHAKNSIISREKRTKLV